MARDRREPTTRLPRHGYVLVTITARDANGFLHRFGEVEAPAGTVNEAIALVQLQSRAMDEAHRSGMTA